MALKYHQATFKLLGERPVGSPEAKALLKKREATLGIKFPESLREWYGLKGAVDILETYSNMDPPVPLEELGNPSDIGPDLMLIRSENQSVAWWYVRLDGSDDPPVDILSEMLHDGSPVDPDSPIGGCGWARQADTFSRYVYQCVLSFGGSRDLRKAVKAMEKAGASVFFDARGEIDAVQFVANESQQVTDDSLDLLAGLEIESLTILANTITRDGWTKLARLKRLGCLNATGETFDDRAIEIAGSIPGLHRLLFSDSSVSAEGLSRFFAKAPITWLNVHSRTMTTQDYLALGEARCLEFLMLDASNITDEGLAGVGRLHGLEQLFLEHTGVTDAGLVHLRDLTGLERLGLRETQVEGPGLHHLVGMQALQRLNLNSAPVTDSGAKAIAAMSSLQRLEVAYTKLTDRGVAEFAALENLKELDVEGLKLDPATLADLKQARPALQIVT